jgi:hypothetical protein
MRLTWIEGLVCVAIVACIAWIGFAMVEDQKAWQQFSATHDCKKVAYIRGDVFNTFGTDGRGNMTVGIGSTPDKTGWLCNDGVTYYR